MTRTSPGDPARDLLRDCTEIWQAGLAAVKIDCLIDEHLQLESGELWIDDFSLDLKPYRRVIVVGAGKAAAAMAFAIERVVEKQLPVTGWVNVPEQSFEPAAVKQSGVTVWPARPAGCNEPTPAAIHGTRQIVDLVRTATKQDLVIVALTGGGSALLCLPCEGVSLEDKVAVTRWLSSRGANIQELNAVRSQLSEVKGGGLLRACRAGYMLTVVLSDVLGDPLEVIASGPTILSPSSSSLPPSQIVAGLTRVQSPTAHVAGLTRVQTPASSSNGIAQALAVLNQYDPDHQLPHSIYQSLQHRLTQPPMQPPLVPHAELIIGNLATAVDAAGIRAESLGYSHAMFVARQAEGTAEAVGRHLAEMAVSMLQGDPRSPDCLISGGEPTVQLAPATIRGRGGRNTHLLLAAMIRFQELQCDEQIQKRVVLMSAGTDGEDGPTDAAGAILTHDVWQRAKELKLDARDYLHRSDSYTFFQLTGGLYITGPTNTNVCDMRVLVVDRPASS